MTPDPAALIREYTTAYRLHEQATDDRHRARLDAALRALFAFDAPADPDWVNW